MNFKELVANAPWKKGQAEPQKTGLNIQAFVRNLLMSELNIPVEQAQTFADKFAEEVESAAWLETSRGLTFDRQFDPGTESTPPSRDPGPSYPFLDQPFGQ